MAGKILVTFLGETRGLREWSRHLHLNPDTVKNRWRDGIRAPERLLAPTYDMNVFGKRRDLPAWAKLNAGSRLWETAPLSQDVAAQLVIDAVACASPMTYDEIADVMGVPVAVVEQDEASALAKLQHNAEALRLWREMGEAVTPEVAAATDWQSIRDRQARQAVRG